MRDDLKVIAEGFKPVAAPDIEVRRRMPERLKVRVVDVLMKDRHCLQLDAPMRRQCFVPRCHCFDFLNQFSKRAKNGFRYILRSRRAQCVKGMPNMVIGRWSAAEGP